MMYICYYCSAVFEVFSTVINHLCEKHEEKCLKYKEKELDCSTGKIGYRTKTFDSIIPRNCNVTVTKDNIVSSTKYMPTEERKNTFENEERATCKETRKITVQQQCNDQYKCYFCDLGFDTYTKILKHLSTNHSNEEIKYRKLELDCTSGKMGYRTQCSRGFISTTFDFATSNPDENNGSVNKITNEIDALSNTDADELLQANSYDDISEDDVNYLNDILPLVVEKLREHGQLDLYKKWCTLVSEDKFPLDNICYLLFQDVIQWYSNPITSQMRYFQSETLKFWEVGYRLFKGKFLRFMSGPRGIGQVVSGEQSKGLCSSTDAHVNFAVPSLNVLNQDSLNPIYPGVLKESIVSLAENLNTNIVKIGIDGKKISQGKGKHVGDIDCWGFENEPSLQDRKDRYKDEKNIIAELSKTVELFDEEKTSMSDILILRLRLQGLFKLIGMRIKDLREVLLKINHGITKFLKLGDCEKGDWKKSRYAPVISSLKVKKYDVQLAIETALRLVNDLGSLLAKLNGAEHLYCKSDSVNMSRQDNYHELKEDCNTQDTRYIKQRTEQWQAIRKQALVTGSTCNKALGLGKLKDQQMHFDRFVLGKEVDQFSEQQLENMKYGTDHEIDGIATLVGRVLPVLHPDKEYFEEGCVQVAYHENKSFLVVSPDGSLREDANSEPSMMYENKCKTSNEYSTDVYYKIPLYYIPQLLCEMHAYKCSDLLFTCWSKQSTTVFRVIFEDAIWDAIWKSLCNLYGSKEPKRQTRFPENIQDIRKQVADFSETNVVFIGEFPSCYAMRSVRTEKDKCETTVDKIPQVGTLQIQSDIDIERSLTFFRSVHNWLKESYKICRTVATEILMFMANDLDRKYQTEINNAHPIAYALKGPSMTNECFAKMVAHIIQSCEQNGLQVIATSSDGQWHKFGVRNWDSKPLTVYQLQKDIWNEEKAKPKSSILSEIRGRYQVKSLDDIRMKRCASGPLIVVGHTKDKPLVIYQGPEARFREKQRETENNMDVSGSLENPFEISGYLNECDQNTCTSDKQKADHVLAYILQSDENVIGDEVTHDELKQGHDEEVTLMDKTYISNEQEESHETRYNEAHSCENALIINEGFINLLSDQNNEGYFEYSKCTDNLQNQMLNPETDAATDNALHSAIQNAYSVLYADVEHEFSEYTNSSELVKEYNREQDQLGNEHENNLNESEHALTILSDSGYTMDTQIEIESQNTDITEIKNILKALQEHSTAQRKNKWLQTNNETLATLLKSPESLCKEMTKYDMILCYNALESSRGKLLKICKSWPKKKIAESLINLFKSNEATSVVKTKVKKTKSPKTLKRIASDCVKKMPKEVLNAIVCENKWEDSFREWQKEAPTNIIHLDENNNKRQTVTWFSRPHQNDDQTVTFHYTDCSHILTCLRSKICTSGIYGLNKQAWVDAALSDQTSLNVGIVIECIDKQSVAFAKRVFAEDVEEYMENHCYYDEAKFIRLIRRWYEAEDEPSIPAYDRCNMRLELRSYLLETVNFGRFPPKTNYIGGIPIVTFEALIVHIDRKLQIYGYLPGCGYNVRALGTQEVEQFFSTMRDMDPSGLGTPKPDDIPHIVAKAAFLDNIRLDPDRGFYMKTTKSAVYPEPEFHKQTDEKDMCGSICETNSIVVRDHFFDSKERKRVKHKRKSGSVSAPDCPSKRQRGVRQHHASDESKMLAHHRKGMTDI